MEHPYSRQGYEAQREFQQKTIAKLHNALLKQTQVMNICSTRHVSVNNANQSAV